MYMYTSSRPSNKEQPPSNFNNRATVKMEDQRGQESRELNNTPTNPFRGYQLGATDRRSTHYGSGVRVQGLPAMGQISPNPHQLQSHNMPEQYPQLAAPNVASYTRRDYQPFEHGMAYSPGYMPQYQGQTRVQPDMYSREHAYEPYLAAAPASNTQYHHGYHHSMFSRSDLDQVSPMHQQHSVIADGGRTSHRKPRAKRTVAAVNTPATTSESPPKESDGLNFNSYAQAAATTERLFRTPLEKVVDDDDVDEVERDKRIHVLSIVDALKHNDTFLPPPEKKRQQRAGLVALSDKQKADWQKWQESAKQVVDVHLSQPKAAEVLELRAWEIVEETVKIHRMGYRLTAQGKPEKFKCSERLAQGLDAIGNYAIVRHKLIKGDNIPDFCVAPLKYARTTISSHWNNSSRKPPRKDATSGPSNPRRIPVKNGSVARKYQSRAALSAKKKQEANGADKDTEQPEDGPIEQEPQDAASSHSKNDGSLSEEVVEEDEDDGDAEHEEEPDEGSDSVSSDAHQERNQTVSARVTDETRQQDPYGFSPGDMQFRSPSLDANDSHPARFGSTNTPMYPSIAPTSANHRVSGSPIPGMIRQRATAASDAGSPITISGLSGQEVLGANSLQYTTHYSQDHVQATDRSLGYRTSTASQPTTGVSSAGATGLHGSQGIVPETRANKKRKL